MTTETVNWTELLQELSAPFPAKALQWRAGSTNRDKTKAQALAYAEPRIYEDRLNECCPGGWQLSFEPWGDQRIICRLNVYGMTRSSTGEAGDSPTGIAGTSAEAQSFKRACSKFGLGRYLYDLPNLWVAYDARSKRLLEVPRLPQPPKPEPAAPTDRLSKERAVNMHRELAVLGIGRSKHYDFASEVLNRAIESFTELMEEEAKAVWIAAKRSDRSRAGMRMA